MISEFQFIANSVTWKCALFSVLYLVRRMLLTTYTIASQRRVKYSRFREQPVQCAGSPGSSITLFLYWDKGKEAALTS